MPQKQQHISSLSALLPSPFWRALNFDVNGLTTTTLDTLPRPSHVPARHFDTFVLLCCWQLWKRRNGRIFRDEQATCRQVLSACKMDADLWRHRLPSEDRSVCDAWCAIFTLAM
ncbi:hypothetical protein HU200_060982 [Digitaria exilis]|uniref:Uncharacterized protein n=1 Tax=Digitaria exilis TaxID=1010633 RepID=A0A835ADE3_9POAL|nr:hypothetical protein HU200_060982 [Digitaria exilis]